MPHEHEQHEETGPPNSGERTSVGSLESAKNHLERCAITSDSGDGGRQEFAPSFSALLDWGIKNQLIFPDESFPFLRRPPDGFGLEHEAWFDESRNRWFKATYANRFGVGARRFGNGSRVFSLKTAVESRAKWA